ncbi:MAG: phenylacetate--CoA ligase family protein [Janthinobacterium lividum]
MPNDLHHDDGPERQDPALREAALLADLPALLATAMRAPGWARHLAGIDPAAVTSRDALAGLPLLRKSALPELQRQHPPFGGFRDHLPRGGRVFASPGPIYEVEGAGPDPWGSARAFHAAGFRPGDLVLNTLAYTMTPGGMILDSGARALGCTTIPAGPGNTAQQVEILRNLRPTGYAGTPDFLKILLDAMDGPAPITKALVSGAAFPPSLQQELAGRGVQAYQAYATADLGVVAYETEARNGLVVNETLLVEIVRPGTGTPVAPGEVGEVVVTSFSPEHPWIRLALGDLSKIVPGPSACGRTNMRLAGWMGRADQAAKIRGLFVRPEQIAEIAARHPGLGRLRLVVTRQGEQDHAQLQAEGAEGQTEALARSFQAIATLKAEVVAVAPGSLPNDGVVIQDRR